VLRLHEDKDYAIVLDHAGNVDKLGFAEDVVPEVLDDGEKKYQERNQVKKDPKERDTMECPMCYQIMKMPSCECGYEIPISMVVDSDNQILRELTKHSLEDIEAFEEERRQQKLKEWRDLIAAKEALYGKTLADLEQAKFNWLAQMQSYGYQKGYKPGWSAYKYKDKFGCWPTRHDQDRAGFDAEITQETIDYVTHLVIKGAKNAKQNTRQFG
jgi:hypothetical protein